MSVTLFGITTFVKLIHPLNIQLEIWLTPFRIVTLASPVQFANGRFPKLIGGIVMLLKFEQELNA